MDNEKLSNEAENPALNKGAVMRSADSIQLRLEDLKLDYDDCKRWYDNAYKKYEDDRKMWGRGEADANEYLEASRQLELIKVQIKQLEWVQGRP
jgi:hypothetical protein